jgi:hypothetical protein
MIFFLFCVGGLSRLRAVMSLSVEESESRAGLLCPVVDPETVAHA